MLTFKLGHDKLKKLHVFSFLPTILDVYTTRLVGFHHQLFKKRENKFNYTRGQLLSNIVNVWTTTLVGFYHILSKTKNI